MARGLDHPAIVAPLAAGLEGHLPWLAQAYVPAESLDSAVAQYGPPPLADVLAIVTHLAGALDFAAAAGVVHGSLHPGNVLVAPDETHLLDLGVAGALHAAGLRPPVHAPYAAPETVQGASPSRAADVFSLGAMAFELLAGQAAPGLGDAALSGLPDIPGAHRETLEETFAFALAEPTDERFPTALGLAAALKRALADAPGHWVAPRPAVSPVADGGKLSDLAVPLPVEETGVASSQGLSASADVPHDVEPPAFDPPVEPGGFPDPSGPEDLVLRATEQADEAETSSGVPGDGDPHRFMDLSVETGGSAADARGDDELPVGLEEPPPAVDDAAPPGPQWDDAEPPDSPPETVAPVVRAPRPRTVAASPRGAAATRTIATAVIAILVLLAAVAAGYLWGRQTGQPAGVGTPGGGTGVASGGTGEAGAPGDTGDPSDTTIELEMPPEPIPEGEAPAQPAASSPAPAREEAQPAGAARPAPAPARSTTGPTRAPAPAPPGQLTIGSTPPGARVEVNGKPSGETPLTLRGLTLGAYDITVTRQGYVPERRRVTLTRGRPSQSVTVPMRRLAGTKGTAQPAVTHASVLVDSRPRGASVYLDGRLVGITPLQLAEVAAGRHVFRLELRGHRRWADTVQIVGGERHRVAASLEEETR